MGGTSLAECRGAAGIVGRFFRYAQQQPWLVGLFPWDWSADPFDGYLCDNGYSVNGKPAYTLFQNEYATLRGISPPRNVISRAGPSLVIFQNGSTNVAGLLFGLPMCRLTTRQIRTLATKRLPRRILHLKGSVVPFTPGRGHLRLLCSFF